MLGVYMRVHSYLSYHSGLLNNAIVTVTVVIIIFSVVDWRLP